MLIFLVKMHKFLIISFIKSVLIPLSLCDNNPQVDQLLSLVVIYRHGDRTPVQPYPTDPYRNASFWPVGFGQLTNTGKLQQFSLGKWLRNRYQTYLPDLYSEKDIFIQSTDVDRTLMSAESNLAGLYPPHNKQIWDQDIKWQPIPIHTRPELEDALLAMKRNCPKYNKLLKNLFQTQYFIDIAHKNHDLYAYLTRYSGYTVSTLENLEHIYNTLFIEISNNLTLPQWAQKVYPTKLEPWAQLSFATACYTSGLTRLKTGPLFNEIVDYFRNITYKNYKLLMFSAHDTTIANILNSLGSFEYHCPPYASTIIFELKRESVTNLTYVNIFYKNLSEPFNITLKGCEFNCKLDDFIKILKPITISLKDWEIECHLNYWLGLFDNIIFITVFSVFISLLLIVSGILIAVKSVKNKNDSITYYTQLPVEDIA